MGEVVASAGRAAGDDVDASGPDAAPEQRRHDGRAHVALEAVFADSGPEPTLRPGAELRAPNAAATSGPTSKQQAPIPGKTAATSRSGEAPSSHIVATAAALTRATVPRQPEWITAPTRARSSKRARSGQSAPCTKSGTPGVAVTSASVAACDDAASATPTFAPCTCSGTAIAAGSPPAARTSSARPSAAPAIRSGPTGPSARVECACPDPRAERSSALVITGSCPQAERRLRRVAREVRRGGAPQAARTPRRGS